MLDHEAEFVPFLDEEDGPFAQYSEHAATATASHARSGGAEQEQDVRRQRCAGGLCAAQARHSHRAPARPATLDHSRCDICNPAPHAHHAGDEGGARGPVLHVAYHSYEHCSLPMSLLRSHAQQTRPSESWLATRRVQPTHRSWGHAGITLRALCLHRQPQPDAAEPADKGRRKGKKGAKTAAPVHEAAGGASDAEAELLAGALHASLVMHDDPTDFEAAVVAATGCTVCMRDASHFSYRQDMDMVRAALLEHGDADAAIAEVLQLMAVSGAPHGTDVQHLTHARLCTSPTGGCRSQRGRADRHSVRGHSRAGGPSSKSRGSPCHHIRIALTLPQRVPRLPMEHTRLMRICRTGSAGS